MSDRPSMAAALPVQLRRALTIALQLGVVVLSNRLAFLLRFDGDLPRAAPMKPSGRRCRGWWRIVA